MVGRGVFVAEVAHARHSALMFNRVVLEQEITQDSGMEEKFVEEDSVLKSVAS